MTTPDGQIGPQHYSDLDDPGFLDAVSAVRTELEHVPQESACRGGIERLYRAMQHEFDRRARAAWQEAS